MKRRKCCSEAVSIWDSTLLVPEMKKHSNKRFELSLHGGCRRASRSAKWALHFHARQGIHCMSKSVFSDFLCCAGAVILPGEEKARPKIDPRAKKNKTAASTKRKKKGDTQIPSSD